MKIRTLAEQIEHERKLKEASRKEWLQSLADAGMTKAEATRFVGASFAIISRDTARYGITGFKCGVQMNGSEVKKAHLEKVKALVAQGMPVREMAEATGRTLAGMRSYLRYHELTAGPANKRPASKKPINPAIKSLVRKLIQVNRLTPSDIAFQTGIDVVKIQNIARSL